MNSKDNQTLDGASRNDNEASPSLPDSIADCEEEFKDDMKRAAAKELIERYFYQLTEGCGNSNCTNIHCVSSGKLEPMKPDQAAAYAVKLVLEEATLCQKHPNKVPRTISTSNNIVQQVIPARNVDNSIDATETANDEESNSIPSNDNVVILTANVPSILTEQILYDLIDECEANDNYSPLIRMLGEIFSSIENLSKSFLRVNKPPIDIQDPEVIKSLKKEELRHLEGERDKDEDSSAAATATAATFSSDSSNSFVVDIPSVRRAFGALFKIKTSIFEHALVNALVTLAGNLQMELPTRKESDCHRDIVNVLQIVFEIPLLGAGDFLDTALPAICRASQWLPVEAQALLARAWAADSGQLNLKKIVENLHQLITIRVIVTPFHHDFLIQDENVITSATKIMKIAYYANILAGVLETPALRHNYYQYQDEMSDSIGEPFLDVIKIRKRLLAEEDQLAKVLGVHVLDCRKPFIPYSEFYNETLSEAIQMDRDFANFKSESGKFSFMNYAFILTPATKAMGLYFDSRIRMYSERRISLIQTVSGQPSNPYLRLKVRRDHIIDDALVELEMIAMENPNDLKKQLVVEFEGEQGIDEGGVSKEFFQLVVEEIFKPDYAMFVTQSESQLVWFNITSFESFAQYTLIGIVLGLAVYNNVILSVNFPMVLYRKLMGRKGSFEDLADWNPVVYNSLKNMLAYNEPDFEDVFLLTFRISYEDVFGTTLNYDLRDNGDEITVTQDNKYEFVDLYADFLLNKSVEKQFRAFYKGFQMVVDESPLELLFRPEEIELLTCGSKNFDFSELENSTEYDAGFTADSQIIKDFWSVVHAFSLEDKRKLLQFTTGSDRVPVGGLSRLKLVIAKNGPDSDRLPTAHTCFNVLLLPEYSSKEKLQDRLLKAINYSKGFGML